MKRISVRIPDELWRTMKLFCIDFDISMNTLVCDSIEGNLSVNKMSATSAKKILNEKPPAVESVDVESEDGWRTLQKKNYNKGYKV